VFMTRFPDRVPNSLLIHLYHNKFLHKKLLFVSVVIKNTPKTNGEKKYLYRKLTKNAYVIESNFGFMEVPSLRKVMNWAKEQNIIKESEEISYFLSKGVPVVSNRQALSGFGENVYIFMAKNALSAYEFITFLITELLSWAFVIGYKLCAHYANKFEAYKKQERLRMTLDPA